MKVKAVFYVFLSKILTRYVRVVKSELKSQVRYVYDEEREYGADKGHYRRIDLALRLDY